MDTERISTQETFVIDGAGTAGAKAAEALNEEGFLGRIVLIGKEPERPYERPLLSKAFLQGNVEREKIFVHTKSWYTKHKIERRSSTKATGIDTSALRVDCSRGGSVYYDKLALTTGPSPRRQTITGSDRHRVYYLRCIQDSRLEDSQRLKFALSVSSRVVIIGGGCLGWKLPLPHGMPAWRLLCQNTGKFLILHWRREPV